MPGSSIWSARGREPPNWKRWRCRLAFETGCTSWVSASDVVRILADAQVSLLVTNWEGFPLSILEAMRAALPVVASAVGGVGESVRDGRTGFLVPPGQVPPLRDRLGILTDSDLRVRLGAQGRAVYESTSRWITR